MGAPKVSRAIFTTSIARTTPAQKPRGLSRRTRFSIFEASDGGLGVLVSRVVGVTFVVYRALGFSERNQRPGEVIPQESRVNICAFTEAHRVGLPCRAKPAALIQSPDCG